MLKKDLEAVFISDLHLHPKKPKITQRFYQFLDWAKVHTKTLYILGDFFHVWPGDDYSTEWSSEIATALSKLTEYKVVVYFMRGNRDFLLGDDFAKKVNMTIIPEPSVIKLGDSKVLLAHGDAYCTQDKSHQWFRILTRNKLFFNLFLNIPFTIRLKLVQGVRQFSENNRSKPIEKMQITVSVMLEEMKKYHTNSLIHGHIHQPGLIFHKDKGKDYKQYILSDWDEKPQCLCYHNTKGLFFYHID